MAEKKVRGGSIIPAVAIVVSVSLAAVAVGWFLGAHIRNELQHAGGPNGSGHGVMAERAASGGHESVVFGDEEDEESHGKPQFEFATYSRTVRLDPIVANLDSTGENWIRIELGLIIPDGKSFGNEAEKMAVTEQIVGLLRRTSVADLSGASAFIQFREDLNDTVVLASAGRAVEARVLSLVIE